MTASMKCLQAPMHTLSSPDCSWLSPLVLDHTRLAPTKPNREPLCRVPRIILCIHSVLFIWHYLYLQCTFDGCEQEFTKCNQLKIHQFVHTNEKPFRSVIKFHSCDFLAFLQCGSSLPRQFSSHSSLFPLFQQCDLFLTLRGGSWLGYPDLSAVGAVFIQELVANSGSSLMSQAPNLHVSDAVVNSYYIITRCSSLSLMK